MRGLTPHPHTQASLMPRLLLDPSWKAVPKTKIPMHSIVLGDGYSIDTDVYQTVDEDYQIEKSGITEGQLASLLLLIRQLAGVDEFEWSPDINRYPLKSYRMPNHSVTKIGLGYYKISALIRRVGVQELPPSPTIISVTASALPNPVFVGSATQLSAVVVGANGFDSSVTWSITGGTASISGTIITPTGAGTITAKATSVQDPTKHGSVSIAVQVPVSVTSITASASPTTITTGSISQLTSQLTGSGAFNPNVVWSIVSGGGSINGTQYTAGSSAGTVILRAASVSTSSVQVNVTLTVQAAVSNAVTGITASASPTTIALNGNSQLSAQVTGTGTFEASVTWSILSGGGSISAGIFGTQYTASSTAEAVILRAASVANPSIQADISIAVQATVPNAVTGITASASPTTIATGATSSLTAQVTGTGNFSSSVTWTVISGGGLISAGMFGAEYTASSSAGTVVLRAASSSTPSVQTDISIIVQAPSTSTGNTLIVNGASWTAESDVDGNYIAIRPYSVSGPQYSTSLIAAIKSAMDAKYGLNLTYDSYIAEDTGIFYYFYVP